MCAQHGQELVMPRLLIGVPPSVLPWALPVQRRFVGQQTPAERKIAFGGGLSCFRQRQAEE